MSSVGGKGGLGTSLNTTGSIKGVVCCECYHTGENGTCYNPDRPCGPCACECCDVCKTVANNTMYDDYGKRPQKTKPSLTPEEKKCYRLIGPEPHSEQVIENYFYEQGRFCRTGDNNDGPISCQFLADPATNVPDGSCWEHKLKTCKQIKEAGLAPNGFCTKEEVEKECPGGEEMHTPCLSLGVALDCYTCLCQCEDLKGAGTDTDYYCDKQKCDDDYKQGDGSDPWRQCYKCRDVGPPGDGTEFPCKHLGDCYGPFGCKDGGMTCYAPSPATCDERGGHCNKSACEGSSCPITCVESDVNAFCDSIPDIEKCYECPCDCYSVFPEGGAFNTKAECEDHYETNYPNCYECKAVAFDPADCSDEEAGPCWGQPLVHQCWRGHIKDCSAFGGGKSATPCMSKADAEAACEGGPPIVECTTGCKELDDKKECWRCECMDKCSDFSDLYPDYTCGGVCGWNGSGFTNCECCEKVYPAGAWEKRDGKCKQLECYECHKISCQTGPCGYTNLDDGPCTFTQGYTDCPCSDNCQECDPTDDGCCKTCKCHDDYIICQNWLGGGTTSYANESDCLNSGSHPSWTPTCKECYPISTGCGACGCHDQCWIPSEVTSGACCGALGDEACGCKDNMCLQECLDAGGGLYVGGTCSNLKDVGIPECGCEGACCDDQFCTCSDGGTKCQCDEEGGNWRGCNTKCADWKTDYPQCGCEGACCNTTTCTCTEGTKCDCDNSGGVWRGCNTNCSDFADDPYCGGTGACCKNCSCSEVTICACNEKQGNWYGLNSSCADLKQSNPDCGQTGACYSQTNSGCCTYCDDPCSQTTQCSCPTDRGWDGGRACNKHPCGCGGELGCPGPACEGQGDPPDGCCCDGACYTSCGDCCAGNASECCSSVDAASIFDPLIPNKNKRRIPLKTVVAEVGGLLGANTPYAIDGLLQRSATEGEFVVIDDTARMSFLRLCLKIGSSATQDLVQESFRDWSEKTRLSVERARKFSAGLEVGHQIDTIAEIKKWLQLKI